MGGRVGCREVWRGKGGRDGGWVKVMDGARQEGREGVRIGRRGVRQVYVESLLSLCRISVESMSSRHQ